jgi:hypothetical protein
LKRETFLHALHKSTSNATAKALANIKKQLQTSQNFQAFKQPIKEQAFLPLIKVKVDYDKPTTDPVSYETTTTRKSCIIDTDQPTPLCPIIWYSSDQVPIQTRGLTIQIQSLPQQRW